jgi:hypothetical protein
MINSLFAIIVETDDGNFYLIWICLDFVHFMTFRTMILDFVLAVRHLNQEFILVHHV